MLRLNTSRRLKMQRLPPTVGAGDQTSTTQGFIKGESVTPSPLILMKPSRRNVRTLNSSFHSTGWSDFTSLCRGYGGLQREVWRVNKTRQER